MKENKLISELYRIHSLIRMINEDVNSETKSELSTFVDQYIDNNDCKTIHDHIDQFDVEGKSLLTDQEKVKFSELKSKADGNNSFGTKLRNAGIFCGKAKNIIKDEFNKLLSEDPDSVYKVLCWFNKNKYKQNDVMKSCSSLEKIQSQTDDQEIKTDNTQPIVEPKTDSKPITPSSTTLPSSEPVNEPIKNNSNLSYGTSSGIVSYDNCLKLFDNVLSYHQSKNGSLPPDDMLKKDNPSAKGVKETLQACLWLHNFGVGQGAVKIKKLYNLTSKGKYR